MSDYLRRAVLLVDGTEHEATPEGDAARTTPCACGCDLVRGRGTHIGGHDYYSARGCCTRCGADRGELRSYVSTIFGLEEDQRVLSHGRCRVYDGDGAYDIGEEVR